MYFSQGVEVTDKVISKLNDDYKGILDKGSKPVVPDIEAPRK
jgi:hypothetical protein